MAHTLAPQRRILGIFLAAVLALAGCGDQLSAASVTESFSQTVSLSPGGSMSVSNVNGRIEVSAWDRNEVQIEAVKRANSMAKLQEIEIDVAATGDQVEIETDLPRSGNASVSYRITAPASAVVEVDTVNGSVNIAGIRGGMNAHSVNGAIEADGLAESSEIKTVNGSVEARYSTAPSSGRHHFKSVNGAISVYMPATPSGRFTAKSVNGSIQNDFGIEVQKARYGPMRSMEGTLGSGAGLFEFSTVNGSIRIRSAGNAASIR